MSDKYEYTCGASPEQIAVQNADPVHVAEANRIYMQTAIDVADADGWHGGRDDG